MICGVQALAIYQNSGKLATTRLENSVPSGVGILPTAGTRDRRQTAGTVVVEFELCGLQMTESVSCLEWGVIEMSIFAT